MKTHSIALDSFIPHGKFLVSVNNGELHMTGGINYGVYIEFPGKFKLPFSIEMTAKMDSPALIMQIGDGYINLNTGGMDNRRMASIIGGETKPGIHKFDNRTPLNEYFNVSVIYGRKAMQLVINGEERYFNTKDAYMKSKTIDADFADGFSLKLVCHQRTEIFVKSLTVTEYDSEPEFANLPKKDYTYAPSLTPTDKPTLEECIADLTPELKEIICETDIYLKSLKFRRKIEGGYPESKITYHLPKIISYKIKISGNLMIHSMSPLLKGFGNKDIYCENFFDKLEKESPAFAEEIFSRMNECKGCDGGSGCVYQHFVEYTGKNKMSCCHDVLFKMIPSDFEDMRKVVIAINELVKTTDKNK